jgi:hypothetical protein
MNQEKYTLMDKQNDAGKHPGSEESNLTFEKQESMPKDEISRKILEKWKNGVIICIWPRLFRNDDDIEMR